MGRSVRSTVFRHLLLAAALLCGLGLPAAHAVAGEFEEGVDLYQSGHYRWALEKLSEAVARSPRNPEALWYLAESYRQLGDLAGSVTIYRRILDVAPGSARARDAQQALTAQGEPARLTVSVPFQSRGTAILVPGRVNGGALGYFILDTGATYVALNRSAADRLGVSESQSRVTLRTVTGLVEAPLGLLEELDVGGAVARYVPVVILDLPSSPPDVIGLLGLSYLMRFRVGLDASSGLLILESGR